MPGTYHRIRFRVAGDGSRVLPAIGAQTYIDTLAAQWIAADGGGTRIPFAEAAFFPGPFPYVWTKSGAIYRVAASGVNTR